MRCPRAVSSVCWVSMCTRPVAFPTVPRSHVFRQTLALGRPDALLAPGSECGAMKHSSPHHKLLIHRENLRLAVAFLCPQLFPQEVRSLAAAGGTVKERAACVPAHHTLADTRGRPCRLCACVRRCAFCARQRKSKSWTLSIPLCFVMRCLPGVESDSCVRC